MDRDSVRDESVKKDLIATVETRKELGEAYESELVDSFLDRVEHRLDARVEQRVRRELAQQGAAEVREARGAQRPGRPRRSGSHGADAWFAAFTLVMAIPLTAIVMETSHGNLAGLLVLWLGIVGVNVARRARFRRPDTAAADPDTRSTGRPRSDWAG